MSAAGRGERFAGQRGSRTALLAPPFRGVPNVWLGSRAASLARRQPLGSRRATARVTCTVWSAEPESLAVGRAVSRGSLGESEALARCCHSSRCGSPPWPSGPAAWARAVVAEARHSRPHSRRIGSAGIRCRSVWERSCRSLRNLRGCARWQRAAVSGATIKSQRPVRLTTERLTTEHSTDPNSCSQP